ncbi:MAG: N-acetylmuramoyl-L-alanine amidase, partial [Ancalomicrobiaceae bacterium]|nr:N-acetylmuramoyl-L-alanine amidase [Ancalomicrobiaceae bacterium]
MTASEPAAAPDAASVPVASHAAVEVSGDMTRFVLDFSRSVAIDAFVLADPYRVVVDLPETRFDLASTSKEARGLIHSWRYGLFATGRSRLVFDLTGPARIGSARVEPTANGAARLTIEVVAVAKEAFVADTRSQPSPTAETQPASPAIDRATPPIPGQKLVVVVDPGHGGLDAGTVSPRTGMPEKQIVLEFGKLLAQRLTDSGRYEVYLTRSTDTFVPLDERVDMARNHHADLLVSIHADAELDRSVRGSTIFTRSEKASDAKAAALAQKENQSDAIAGIASNDKADDISDILFDLTLRETRHFNHAIASYLVAAMAKSGRMVKQDPHRSAQLRVLKAYDVPSV